MWVFIVFLLWIMSHFCPASAPQFELFFGAGRGSLFLCRAVPHGSGPPSLDCFLKSLKNTQIYKIADFGMTRCMVI